MTYIRRSVVTWIGIALVSGTSMAVTHNIDGTLPDGGDCSSFGVWNDSTHTCRIENAQIEAGQWLRIDFATVEVVGTLTNEGLLDNHGTLIVDGFLDSTNDLVNSWDGTLVNRGEFFSHFMYNFGGLTNQATGTIEFELHLENNAPLTNHGSIEIVGNFINIPERTIENFGSVVIAPTGTVTNSGRFVHAGYLDNSGVLLNEAELIAHCESILVGNPIEGQGSTAAQSLSVGKVSLEWCPIDGAQGYDVVEGDLELLRSTGGDFSVATTGCTGNDLAVLSLEPTSEPPSGQGVWFLVRANGVASADFDTVFSSQVGSRTGEIEAAAVTCP
jgi:hypothetical protein